MLEYIQYIPIENINVCVCFCVCARLCMHVRLGRGSAAPSRIRRRVNKCSVLFITQSVATFTHDLHYVQHGRDGDTGQTRDQHLGEH